MSKEAFEQYESRMGNGRRAFACSPALKFMLAPNDGHLLWLFLIYFCSLGVGMTERVESWIYRAGVRCDDLGLLELGRALKRHSLAERNHHLLMINDANNLIARWNCAGLPPLNAEEIISMTVSPAVLTYQQLHEDTIAGRTPYNQIGIEYEIEMLSIRFGPDALKAWIAVLGSDILQCLSFLTDHVEFDLHHSRFNQDTLTALLQTRPEVLNDLVSAGESALSTYGGYLQDCLRLATEKRNAMSIRPTPVTS